MFSSFLPLLDDPKGNTVHFGGKFWLTFTLLVPSAFVLLDLGSAKTCYSRGRSKQQRPRKKQPQRKKTKKRLSASQTPTHTPKKNSYIHWPPKTAVEPSHPPNPPGTSLAPVNPPQHRLQSPRAARPSPPRPPLSSSRRGSPGCCGDKCPRRLRATEVESWDKPKRKHHKPMLNPNSYAIITGKNQWGIQTDRDLQGTLTWTCLEPSLETFCLKPWNLLQRLLGTLIYLEWEPFLGTVACLEPSLKIFGLEPWNLGTSCILKLELLEVSPGTCLEPFNHDKPKPSYMEQCWNLKTPATFQNLLGTAEPLGTSTWNLEPFDTFWNLHLEPVLETRNLYWMLAWNFRAFRNLAFTWNPLLEPLLGTLTWNLGTWNLLEFWNFPEPFLGSLSCLEPSLETWPWTSTWTP